MLAINDKFSFWVPASIEKGKNNKGEEEMNIKGIANSSRSKDSDGETLFPTGFDYTPFLTSGYFNWDHQTKKNPSAIVGEPTKVEIINNGKDLYVEGFLYKDSQEAREIFKLAQVLEKNSKTRKLGFSIEGQVLEKDPTDETKILRAKITGCAITPMPKNPNTLMQIMKGECEQALMEQVYDDEIVKAMSAAGLEGEGAVSESVEGVKKNKTTLMDPSKCPDKENHTKDTKCTSCGLLEKSDHVGQLLKKSEIYDLILKGCTTDVTTAKEIYSFIETVNTKLFNMSNTQISREAVTKALELLKATDATILDGGIATQPEAVIQKGAGDDTSAEDDMEKAKTSCKDMIEKGKKEDEIKDELKKGGFSEDTANKAYASVVADASVKKDGGDITPVTAPVINKAEDIVALGDVIVGKTSEIMKGFTDSLKQHSDKKFQAMGVLLGSQNEAIELLKGQNDDLKERLGKIENTPNVRKSVTGPGAAKPVERFAKSQTGADNLPAGAMVYNVANKKDLTALSDRLFEEACDLRKSNTPDLQLENMVSEMEIMKGVMPTMLPCLQKKNIYVISESNA